jgi:SAM-dependent methyltransferase/pimeloyl-ACP methyl ester carboxylesterase
MLCEDRSGGPPPRDKRKHTRIEHSSEVEFTSEGRSFIGHSVNISKSGMQVIVNVPDSHRSVRSIAFTLPNSGERLHVPCRLVRAGRAGGELDTHVVGVEFSHEAEAQMLLIERFIREMKQGQLAEDAEAGEQRRIPRAACLITDVEVDNEAVLIRSIDNISTEGLLVSFEGQLEPDQRLQLSFCLTSDARRQRVRGRVMYVISNSFGGVSTAGIRLEGLTSVMRNRLNNFVVEATASSAMRNVHERFNARELNPNYRIDDPERIREIFRVLRERELTLNALIDRCLRIVRLEVQSVDTGHGSFSTRRAPDVDPAGLARHCTAYFSFYLDGGSHYFKAALQEDGGELLCFSLPPTIYLSEKRSYQRKVVDLRLEVELFEADGSGTGRRFPGKVIDISWRGFLCELPFSAVAWDTFKPMALVGYALNPTLGLGSRGLIRHKKKEARPDGGMAIQLGVEADIQQSPFRFRRYSSTEWQRWAAVERSSPRHSPGADPGLETVAVEYRNSQGQAIAALLNLTRPGVRAPVVIIPPALGKKKEALLPLVAVLMANFRRQGKDLVTLRYDGINRPGESYRRNADGARGTELLQYRLSQGREDLKTTLEFVHHNDYFEAEKVILITFSMSTIDARRLLATEPAHGVDLWITCMGLPCAKSAIGNLLGGIDIIGNHKMGIPSGVGGILGYLVNMDTLARDLVTNKYAYITDARLDMSRISTPVLWVSGTYDGWVPQEEIRDVMAVRAPAPRELVEIPTGHNLRSSDDAIATFRLIAAYLYEQLHGEPLLAVSPARSELLRLVTYERERLQTREVLNVRQYWRSYLIGDGRDGTGYDFYGNLRDFRTFLSLEVELTSPAGQDRIADMGCGTGLFLQRLLQELAERGPASGPVHIVAVDLVQEALDRARAKLLGMIRANPTLSAHQVEFVPMNLEVGRLEPVRVFIEDPTLGFDYLRNRVQGLRNVTLDLLSEKASPALLEIMRGCEMTQARLAVLEQLLKDGHQSAVLEFNRAARFLRGRLITADLSRPGLSKVSGSSRRGRLTPADHGRIRTGDLRFSTLYFGDSGLTPAAPFPDAFFTKIVASLFLSYVFDPVHMLEDFCRMLAPGGKLIVSSMRPDSDMSVLFTEYIERVQRFELQNNSIPNRDANLDAARAMLNTAAALFTLEEEGIFRFYSELELTEMLQRAGLREIQSHRSLGDPPQAVIVTGRKI